MAIPVLFKFGYAESVASFPLSYIEYASSNVAVVELTVDVDGNAMLTGVSFVVDEHGRATLTGATLTVDQDGNALVA